jgi:hypothetical protein
VLFVTVDEMTESMADRKRLREWNLTFSSQGQA